MTEPALFDPDMTPTVTLNGKAWPIPTLVWRDLRKCRKELLELSATINAEIAAAHGVREDGEDLQARNMRVMSEVFQALSNDDFDRLIMGPVHAGLVAAHPALTREELDGWPLTEPERQIAWLTVRRQSGLFVGADAEADEPGEAAGAA